MKVEKLKKLKGKDKNPTEYTKAQWKKYKKKNKPVMKSGGRLKFKGYTDL